ncbi:hypothetical protein C2S51_019177 [Perilla frutescens var. frutescens]|nr:hypothetical protein C2S51_019177 [Perilla frutescens var. frutescens]
MLRSIIGSDMDLLRLFTMEPEPTVYLVHNQNVGGTQPEPFTVQDVMTQPESSTHYPTNTQPDPYSYVPQFDCSAQPSLNPTDEDIERFERSNWLSDNWWGSGSGGGSPFHDAQNADVAANSNGVVETDDDYDDEADLDVPSEDDEEPFGTGFSNCTFHDFTSWIHREGSINQLLSMLVPTNQPITSRSQVEPEPEDVRNWIIPVIPLDCTDSPVVRNLDHVIDEPLRKGSIFYTKEDLYVAVGLWHMERKAEFKVPRSYGSRVEYVCKCNPSCTFELRASWRGSYWIVHKFNMQHTCNLDLGSVGARNVRAKAIAAYYARKIRREEKIMKPRDIMAELLHEFGIRGSYQVALRARNAAISMIYGGHIDSYQKLPSYLYMLKACNPNTYTDLDVGPDGRFRHCFIALGSYGPGIVELFQITANTYRPKVYEKAMEAIGKSSPGAWNKLMTAKPERWARSQCPVSRFSFPTSNIAESFNSRLLFARRLPIVSTIEAIRHVMEEWFDQRRAVSRARDDDLTEEAHNKLAPQVDKGDHFRVVARSQMTFKVSNKESSWIVDLNSRTCECHEFQDDLMPCSHASTAIRNQGMSVYDFVSVYYKTENWKELYAAQVNPILLEEDWNVPSEVKDIIVLPPIVLRQSGRSREQQFATGADIPRSRRAPTSIGVSGSHPRAKKRCSICGETTHTKNRCPLRFGFDNLDVFVLF